MSYCPSPGPPCYTEKSTSTGNAALQAYARILSPKSTEIAWQRKYFYNPIVSSIPITARIYDVNKSTVLVNFEEVLHHDLCNKDLMHYYVPQGLDKLENHTIVVYEFIENDNDHYEFKIQIL